MVGAIDRAFEGREHPVRGRATAQLVDRPVIAHLAPRADQESERRGAARRLSLPALDACLDPGVGETAGGGLAGAAAGQALDSHRLAVALGRGLREGLGPRSDHRGHPHRVGPVAVVPPDPVAAADMHLGRANRGLDPVDVEEPVVAPPAALGAGEPVDRLHEAAAIARRDLGLAIEEADHRLRRGRVVLRLVHERLGAVVPGHGQGRRPLGRWPGPEAAAGGRGGAGERRRGRQAATHGHRLTTRSQLAAIRSLWSPRLTTTLSWPPPQLTRSRPPRRQIRPGHHRHRP